MDIWQNIKKRASDMEAANAEQAQKDSIAEAKRKRKEEEFNEMMVAVGVVIVFVIFIGWAGWEAISFCSSTGCGR
jgi:uncharacterized membrane protein